jgi:hypothetical protein
VSRTASDGQVRGLSPVLAVPATARGAGDVAQKPELRAPREVTP